MTRKNRLPRSPGPAEVTRAGRLLKEGKLVAFPTETVYGLGANALDGAAVERIYEAKGRPLTSPLIVHVASVEQARSLTIEWPEAAGGLASRFWPGPLTLVLRKAAKVSNVVTAGLPTVGLRMPDHPVALALIQEAGVPIAAPSANPFTSISPTEAGHLDEELRSHAACVIDGGASPVGIESTVLSLAGGEAVLLRPGMISREAIEDVVGPVRDAVTPAGAHPSPGMHPKHYAPSTRLVLVRDGDLPAGGRGAYVGCGLEPQAGRVVAMPGTPAEYAARLYAILHELDQEGWDWIAVEEPPGGQGWDAIRDRLRRAAGR